jgi:hypothetical protein
MSRTLLAIVGLALLLAGAALLAYNPELQLERSGAVLGGAPGDGGRLSPTAAEGTVAPAAGSAPAPTEEVGAASSGEPEGGTLEGPPATLSLTYPRHLAPRGSEAITLNVSALRDLRLARPTLRAGQGAGTAPLPSPVGAAAGAGLADAFPGHTGYLVARLVLAEDAFAVTAALPERQSLDQGDLSWRWIVRPNGEGSHIATITLTGIWEPDDGVGGPITRLLWTSAELPIDVEEPLISRGQVQAAGLTSALLGAGFCAPWLLRRLRRGAALRARHELPPANSPDAVPLSVRFEPDAGGARLTWEADVIGVRRARLVPPYAGPDLDLVVRALDLQQSPREALSVEEARHLAALGLPADGGQPAPDLHRRVGRALYAALAADPQSAAALATGRDTAAAAGKPLALRLRFPPDAVDLAALPWELLWAPDEPAPVLLSRADPAICTRYLELAAALPQWTPRSGRLRILAVRPAAGFAPDAATGIAAAEEQLWRDLEADGVAEVRRLSPATRAALRGAIVDGRPPDIVHITANGAYRDGRGWLIMDAEGGGWDRVPAEALAPLFGEVRMVLLNACQGAAVGLGDDDPALGLLTGLAPALSAAGVPVVVGMQLTIRQDAAARAGAAIYRAVAAGRSAQHAVALARQALYVEEPDGVSWYVPVVYVRAREAGPVFI